MITGPVVAAALTVSSSTLASVAVKATLVLALGLLGTWLLRHACAARRSLALASIFGVLALLPAISAFTPPLAIAVGEAAPVAALHQTGGGTGAAPASSLPITQGAGPRDMPAPAIARADARPGLATWTPRPAIVLVHAMWAIGALLCLVPMALGWRDLRRLSAGARPWPAWDTRVQPLARGFGIRRPVALWRHDAVDAPMTWGVRRPVILFPEAATTWTDADVERALVHELAHVRRADWPLHVFARTVCAAYWFHPLAWHAWRQLRLEADRACDDAAMREGAGDALADQLVRLARGLSSKRVRPMLAMARTSDLSTRVRAALNPRQARGPAGRRWAIAVVLAALAVVAALAPLTAVEGPASALDAQAQADPEPIQRFEAVLVKRSDSPARGMGLAAHGLIHGEAQLPGEPPFGRTNSFMATAVSLEGLIRFAYGIGHSSLAMQLPRARPWASVEGVPEWDERFDIRAKTPDLIAPSDAATLGPFQAMVRTLLAERFNLLAHWETRSRPVSVLTRIPGAPAPRLRTSAVCERAGPSTSSMRRLLMTVPAPEPPMSLDRAPCGSWGGMGYDGQGDLPFTQHFRMGAGSFDWLVRSLQLELEGEVSDRTGIEGRVSMELRYTRDPTTGLAAALLASVPPGEPLRHTTPSPEWPSLVDALRDQLGLRLDRQSTPVDVLVVDRAERPALDP